MTLEDTELGTNASEETPPPAESSNRTFLIAAGILGGVMLLALFCLGLYYVFFGRQRADQRATQVAQINAQNTQVAQAAAMTAEAVKWTATPTATRIPATATATPTQVVVVPTQVLATATQDPRTATVAALLTQAASAKLTVTPTASGLPETGFAEDVGVPTMAGLALALIAVIFISRRLRTAG